MAKDGGETLHIMKRKHNNQPCIYIGIGTIFKSGEGHIERLHTTIFHIDSKAFGNDVEDDTDTFINSLQDLDCI